MSSSCVLFSDEARCFSQSDCATYYGRLKISKTLYCTAHILKRIIISIIIFRKQGLGFASVHVTANVFFDAHQQLQGYLRIELYTESEKYDRM